MLMNLKQRKNKNLLKKKLTATYVFNQPIFAISLSVSACCLETLSASYWRVCSCFFTNSLSDSPCPILAPVKRIM